MFFDNILEGVWQPENSCEDNLELDSSTEHLPCNKEDGDYEMLDFSENYGTASHIRELNNNDQKEITKIQEINQDILQEKEKVDQKDLKILKVMIKKANIKNAIVIKRERIRN